MKINTEITLTLNDKEAQWLKGLIQNPMCAPQDEQHEDANMRKALWDALSHVTPR